jgi:uncharacterized protein YkwD
MKTNGALAWKFWLLSSLLLLSCSLSGMKPIGYYKNPTPTPLDCGQTMHPDLEARVIELINQARAANGLSPLAQNDLLTGGARRHSTDMVCHNFMDTTGTDGASWHELMVQNSYLVKYGGIVTAGASDPETAVQLWADQTDGVIQDKTPTEIGVGVASKPGTQYAYYWTVLYALPSP